MVSSRDSTVNVQDLCAYLIYRQAPDLEKSIDPFDSGNREVPARHGWSLFVSLPIPSVSPFMIGHIPTTITWLTAST